MTTLGFCTHFTKTDELAFELAFRTVRANDWQLTICHWLQSPYRIRRDMVEDDLFHPDGIEQVTPKLLTRLELQMRQYYEAKLEDFTNVAFKLCEGQYQVELARCLHANLLDLVVMGYPPVDLQEADCGYPIEEFAAKLPHPLVLVEQSGKYLLNASALAWLDRLDLPEGSWRALEIVPVS